MKTRSFNQFVIAIFIAILAHVNVSICQTYIEEYTEYTGVHNFTENLIITPGNELVVYGEVHFGVDAKLIVQRNAKLTVDGGKTTNLNDNMWRGIEVWGNINQPQLVAYQGKVEIKNGGTIEYAKIGIRTIRAEDDQNGKEIITAEYAGGIVIAANSHFLNNNVAVQFYPYQQNSISNFFKCFFDTSPSLLLETQPDYFIRIHRISGIKVIECAFTNSTGLYEFYGNGIYSCDANFFVDGTMLYPSQWQNTVFRKLNYGINVVNTNTVFYPDIRHSDFSDNRKGVYISCADGARVTSCNFHPIPIDCYGLYLNNSFKYHVEDNFFKGKEYKPPQPPVGIGIYINNSGGLWNQVYNNWFELLNYGTICYGLNRNPFGDGLCIECNGYSININDIIVNGLMGDSGHGIAHDQGWMGANDTLPAGNTFSPDNPLLIFNYKNSKSMGFINYVYHGINISPFKIIPFPYYNDQTMYRQESPYTTFDKEVACPSKLETWDDEDRERSAMEYAEEQMQEKKSQIEEMLDNGNTFMMNLTVLNSTPSMTSEVYNELINTSPYVSDTVLKSAIYKENVLPNAMVRDVLVANPQSAKSNDIMEALDERFTPMPDWMKEQVLEGVNFTSAKESLETEIRYWDRKRSDHFENIYQHYRKDTINSQASTDSLITFLQQDNRLESKYRLAFINMEQGAGSEAQTVLSSVPLVFDLTPKEESVNQDYVSLVTVLNQLNGSIPTEGSQEASELELLASKDENYPGACARNILIVSGLMDYEEPIILLEEELKSIRADESIYSNVPDVFNVFPNPAGDYFIIDYNAEEFTGEFSIKAMDIWGNPMLVKNLSLQKNQEVINVKDWATGIYTINLIINGNPIQTEKISVKH